MNDSREAMEMGFEALSRREGADKIPKTGIAFDSPARDKFLEEYTNIDFGPGQAYINGEPIGPIDSTQGVFQFHSAPVVEQFTDWATSFKASFDVAGESFTRFAQFMLDAFPSIKEYQDWTYRLHKRRQRQRAAAMRQWTKRGRRHGR